MIYLLNTHTFLWFITDDVKLSPSAKVLIEAPENSVYLSIASLWEIAIKVSVGKLEVPSSFTEFMVEQLRENNITLMEVKAEHTDVVVTLPFSDPFRPSHYRHYCLTFPSYRLLPPPNNQPVVS